LDSAEDFRRHYWPTCWTIGRDNTLGRVAFGVTAQIKKRHFTRRAVLRMTFYSQQKEGSRRRLNTVLWDTFTGSRPYRESFLRTLRSGLLARFLWRNTVSILAPVWVANGSQHAWQVEELH
jgi:hypothetical protein